MPNENDTGLSGNDTGDTGEQSSNEVTICEMKLEEFNERETEYLNALQEWRIAYAASEEAERALDDAWNAVAKAQADLSQAEQQRDAGNPNQSNIDSARARIAEIDAIDPKAELDRLMPRLTGEESGGEDDAWTQARYYLGLIQERAELQAQIEQWEQFDPSALDAAVAAAETALQAAKDDRKIKHAEFVRREVEAQRLRDLASNARNFAINARNRYIDFDCPSILEEEIDEPEYITP